MKKYNCWEVKRCGRGPAGKNNCVVVKDGTFNGIHGGVNAGRACWVVAGTGGEAPASGAFAVVLKDCLRCDFFKLVQAEEQGSETGFSATRLGMLKILQGNKHGQDASTAPGSAEIDPHLRKEFVQEVDKVMSGKNDMASELIEEFAKEVKLLSSKTDKKDS
jgi:hypothetical protein